MKRDRKRRKGERESGIKRACVCVREIGRDRDAHTETERDRGIKKVRDTERDRHSEGQRSKEWQRLRETEE